MVRVVFPAVFLPKTGASCYEWTGMSLPRGKEQGFETAIPDALPTAQAFIAAVSLGRLMHPGLASARGSPEDEAEFPLGCGVLPGEYAPKSEGSNCAVRRCCR